MSNQILASAYLSYCPNCNNELDLVSKIGEKETVCNYCGYAEPAGSAEAVTFLSACLTDYMADLDISSVYIRESEFTVRECMQGNGLLPLFVGRAQQILDAAGLSNVPGFSLNLKIIDDDHALLKKRVISEDPSLGIMSAMLLTVESIHETIGLSRELKPSSYESELFLDFMPTVNPSLYVSEAAEAKLQEALSKASKQISIDEAP